MSAALTEGVGPVAWAYDTPNRNGTYSGNASLLRPVPVGNVHIEPLYSADQLAAAHAKGREAGLLAAIADCEKLAKLTNSPVAGYCAAAIERLMEKGHETHPQDQK